MATVTITTAGGTQKVDITTGTGTATQTILVGARGPQGAQGPPGSSATIDSYVSDIATLPDYPTSFPTTPADINNIGGHKLIGRHTGTTGAGQEIGIDGGLAFHSGQLKVDLATAASTWRTELGLGSLATLSSVSLTTNVTGTLPVANGGTGGTTAADARANLGAVGLTGSETIAGSKTFSGQMELTGQAATNSTSAMTRALGDARYGNFLVAVKSSDTARSNTTTYANDPHLTLDIPSTGLWLIELSSFSTAADATGGMKQQLTFSGTFNGVRSFWESRTGNQGVQFPSGALSTTMRGGTAGSPSLPIVIVAATNRTIASCLFLVLDVTATGTLTIQWAQNASSATATTLVGGSSLRARYLGP